MPAEIFRKTGLCIGARWKAKARSQKLEADNKELVANPSWGRHGGVILGLGKPRQEDQEFKAAWTVKQDSVSKLRGKKSRSGERRTQFRITRVMRAGLTFQHLQKPS